MALPLLGVHTHSSPVLCALWELLPLDLGTFVILYLGYHFGDSLALVHSGGLPCLALDFLPPRLAPDFLPPPLSSFSPLVVVGRWEHGPFEIISKL